jgi:hypothetical protein
LFALYRISGVPSFLVWAFTPSVKNVMVVRIIIVFFIFNFFAYSAWFSASPFYISVKITTNVFYLQKVNGFENCQASTKVDAENQTLINLRQDGLRSTEPPLLPNPC